MQDDRPPFVPQPELRDTVPNIGLYSVLYKLPPHNFPGVAAVTSSQVGRQLSSAVDFFDKVVPNQPGYSSSVAAVTILPNANQLARAWKKWYACARKLRRLRFIRRRLRKLREGQDQRVQIVFESGSTNPLRAGSLSESWSNGEQNDTNSNGGEIEVVTDLPMRNHPDQSPSAVDTSHNVSPENSSKPQKGSTQATTSHSGFGSTKEKIHDVMAPPRSTTPHGFLETVDEGSSSDSNTEFSGPEDHPSEFESEAQVPSEKSRSMGQNSERGLMDDKDRLISTLSCDSSEYSHDFEEPSDDMYRLDQVKLSPFPKMMSSASHPSNASLGHSNDRHVTGSLENSAQRNRFHSSVGIQEELKLEQFLSDDDIEQLTVYCQEFARR